MSDDDARLEFCRRLAADAGRLAHGAFGRAALLPAKGRHTKDLQRQARPEE